MLIIPQNPVGRFLISSPVIVLLFAWASIGGVPISGSVSRAEDLLLGSGLPESESANPHATALWQLMLRARLDLADPRHHWARALHAAHPVLESNCLSCHSQPLTGGHGSASHVWYLADSAGSAHDIGVSVVVVDDALRVQLELQEGQGLLVNQVADGSLAMSTGIQRHDVLLTAGGKPLNQVNDLAVAVAEAGSGTLQVGGLSRGKKVTYDLALKNWLTVGLHENAGIQTAAYRLGVRTGELDSALRAQLALNDGQGICVTEVIAGTPAEQAGIHLHDVVVMVDERPIKQLDDLRNYLQESAGKQVTVRLIRAGKTLSIEVTPELKSETQNTSSEAVARALYFIGDRALIVDVDNAGSVLPKVPAMLEERLAALLEQSKQLSSTIESLGEEIKKVKSEATPANK